MARNPEEIAVDTMGTAYMRSLAPARATLLRSIAAKQHAVMSGFGGPPVIWSAYVDGTVSATTRELLLRCPPGVERAAVAVLCRGRGTVDLYTTDDTDGVRIRVSTGTARETLRWVVGSPAGGSLPLINRSLQLLGAATEGWSTITGTIEVDGPELFGLQLIPLHRAR